jgi:predicted kinase
MELLLFVGLQASGKTSFYVERFLNTHARVSLDQLRTRHREKRFLDVCLETQMPVVVDNTNPTKDERRRYVEAAKAAGCAVHLYFFQSRVAECVGRNEARPEEARVPRLGLLGTSSRLEIPSRDEGFDVMKFVRISAGGGFDVEEWRDEVR